MCYTIRMSDFRYNRTVIVKICEQQRLLLEIATKRGGYASYSDFIRTLINRETAPILNEAFDTALAGRGVGGKEDPRELMLEALRSAARPTQNATTPATEASPDGR